MEWTPQGVACYVRKSLSCSHTTHFCRDIESIFIDIFLRKSKPILKGVLYRLPNKLEFVEYHDNSFKESNICNIQESYHIGDFNVNLLSENKMLLKKQYSYFYSHAPHLIKKYINLCFSHFLHQLIMEKTRTKKHTKTLIDHTLTNSPEKSDSEWRCWNGIMWSWGYLLFAKSVTFQIKWAPRNFIFGQRKIIQMKFT